MSKISLSSNNSSAADVSSAKTRVYGVCLALTLFWMLMGVGYIAWQPSNFMSLRPHEFGSTLSGWAAPMAALWVIAAVLLQRAQLDTQTKQLQQTAEELRRSIEQLEKNSLASRLSRLSERLMHGILRFLKTLDGPDFYLAKGEEHQTILTVLGGYKRYSPLFKASELSMILRTFSRGLQALVLALNGDWVMHVDVVVIDEVCNELSSLLSIVSQITSLESLVRELSLQDDAPEPTALNEFRERATEAYELLDLMLHELRNFDSPGMGSLGIKRKAASK